MRRYTFIILALLYTCLFSYAQDERWQVYLSYTEAVQVEAAGNCIYAVMKGSGTRDKNTGNLVRYDLEDGSVKAYDCLHHLNDKEIAHISYNKTTRRLLIVYVNGNIDLLDDDDNVYNISALKDKSIQGASVNQITHDGDKAYLSTKSGIIEIDINEAVVKAQYRQDKFVYGMQFLSSYIYIATKDGLYLIESADHLYNQKSWLKVSDVEFREIYAFANILYALSGSRLCYIKPNEQQVDVVTTSYYFNRIKCLDNQLICLDNGAWMALFNSDSPLNPTIIRQDYGWHDCKYIAGQLFVCDKKNGLIPYTFDSSAKRFEPLQTDPVFKVHSPSRDRFYHISYVGDRLLVSGGINTQTATYYPETFMLMEEENGGPRWTLFDEKTPLELYPKLSHNNSVDLVQDPMDDRHFYGAVYRNGLHEYRMNDEGEVKFVGLYNYENSPLEYIPVENTPVPWNLSTCTALRYDRKGNLWMANQQTDTIVRVLRPNGQWVSLFYPEIAGTTNVFQYLFSSHGINFLVSYEGEKCGFFGFDTGGVLNIADDDRHLLRHSITNQDGTTVIPTQFYCMAEDMDGQVWCGTNEGLFVITNPLSWFDSNFTFHQIKRNRDDGSGFADYLLGGVDITWIEVDPINRKWVGTLNNGVYLISQDGQETIHHFTVDNSPLLSNRINSIAVNRSTGRVMFATEEGLCSFDENVVQPEEFLDKNSIYAIPNTVEPNSNDNVTIMGLPHEARVRILSAAGRVIWSKVSVGGNVQWNCTDAHGNKVPSGVYHVSCSSSDGKQNAFTRIVVIR